VYVNILPLGVLLNDTGHSTQISAVQ